MRQVLLSLSAALALTVGNATVVSEIETVSDLDVDKYLGTWYQVYTNEITKRNVTDDLRCITAEYGLDVLTGNMTMVNAGLNSTTGEPVTATGYAYLPDDSEPGKWILHMEGVEVDGDYWIVDTGLEAHGPDLLYEWSIVTERTASYLYVLARDVEEFKEFFADDVLQELEDLGFVGDEKEPIEVDQDDCIIPAAFSSKVPQVEGTPILQLAG